MSASYYFVSDVHLGLKVGDSRERELAFVSFLKSLPKETKALYLLGDIFDFWFEYRDVVPKGYVRTLGELARLCDEGVEVYFFKGNHDCWTFGYLEEELGVKVLDQPYITEIDGKIFCLGHGDGLWGEDKVYKIMRSIFRSRICIFLFSLLHSRIAFMFGSGWSRKRRLKYGSSYNFRGEEEPLYKFANEFGKDKKIDYYIFGHIHSPAKIDIPSGGTMYVLGDWMKDRDYLNFSGRTISGGSLKKME
ncbi:MAG: UDP-2,3-diacylglucosamine diphosphatase [Bacteroidales bacterium]|nr:UDP-2,3-diacylglucosamine diphosphatase [Bacteroidales bacterium]